jgi:hypothetical protein
MRSQIVWLVFLCFDVQFIIFAMALHNQKESFCGPQTQKDPPFANKLFIDV